MERRTYNQLFGKISNKQFRNLSLLCSTLCCPRRTKMAIIGFLLFVLTTTLEGMFLCGANELIAILVALECFSLYSYLLSGYTKRDLRSNKVTMKCLLMSRASSSILVRGFSWLYGSPWGHTRRTYQFTLRLYPTNMQWRKHLLKLHSASLSNGCKTSLVHRTQFNLTYTTSRFGE